MDKTILLALLRHMLTIGGGWIVAKGFASAVAVEQAIGFLLSGAGVLWSLVDKQTVAIKQDKAIVEAEAKGAERAIEQSQCAVVPSVADFDKGYELSSRSLERLKGVHPDLVRVVQTAITTAPFDFFVIEGVRSPERQQQLFYGKPRRTTTLRSKHLIQEDGFAHAVDLGFVTKESRGQLDTNLANYRRLNQHIQQVAEELGMRVEWGGDWTKFRDGYHFQIVE